MEQIQDKSWVWRSTEASRAAGVVSVLAVAETLACVVAYWALIMWWGVTWHHWVILVAAPMVLLRSPQSIALGVKWFDEYLDWESKKPIFIKMISAAVTSFIVSTVAVFIFIGKLLSTSNNLIIFFIIILVALAAINTVLAVKVAILSGYAINKLVSFLVVISIPGVLIGVWLRALFVRVGATIFYIWDGLTSLPHNWRFACIYTDIFHPPELVPEHKRTTLGGYFSFSSRDDEGAEKKLAYRIVEFFAIFILYTPTLLWRWSIKSTAWFYLPLVWAHWTWVRAEGEELGVWAKTYPTTIWNIVWFIVAILYLAFLAAVLVDIELLLELAAKLRSEGAPLVAYIFPLALDWKAIIQQPWLWFIIPSYALTIYIFLMMDQVRKEIEKGGASPDTRQGQMQRLRHVTNLRSIFTSMGMALALYHVLRAFDAWGQFTAFITRIAAFNPPLV